MNNDLRKAMGADSTGRVLASEHRLEKGRPTKKRAKKEGHDELIARLAPVGTEISLFLNDGSVVRGRLQGSDRFTITVADIPKEAEEDALSTDEESPVVIFYKHSITAFKLNVIGDRAEKRG